MNSDARQTIRAFLADEANRDVISHVQAHLGLSKEVIEAAYLRYAVESMFVGNEIYSDVGTHVAMWIEYQMANGLHARRQESVVRQLQLHRPTRVADIGFGAPTAYLRDYVLHQTLTRVCLFDRYEAAIEVGRAILSYWCDAYNETVDLSVHNMDTDGPIAAFDCYLLLDAIEHAIAPDRYLADTVVAANARALFLLHVPIGPLIPSHSIAWAGERDATRWLESTGLDILETELISPNPAVDHFARGHIELNNLFVVARKT